jgi:hypothetical protein
VRRIGFQIAAGGGSGPWASPATVVLVDSIVLAGGPAADSSWTFDASGDESALVIDPYAPDGLPAGTAITWLGP